MFKKNKLHSSIRKHIQSLTAGAAAMVFIPGLAIAQEVERAGDDQVLEEIIVTGSLIRGVEATGSQTIGMDTENIVEVGAVTTNELLASIPQVSNYFNQRPEIDPRGADRIQVNRPNLRNLPGVNVSSGSTTLILVDGHRLAPVGTDQSSLDPDIVPIGVLKRVDVVTDGGSSLYGADAVGGVINFVTIDEFDGVQVDLGYDTADDFDGWQGSILAGTSWDTGSGYISLATTDRDAVHNEDRDWAATGNWNEDGTVLTPNGTECRTPVGAVTSWYWYGSGWTSNPAAPGAGVTPVGDPCDASGKSSLQPKQERDNVYVGLTQELGDNISLKVKGYYMDRTTKYSSYPQGDTIAEPTPTELGLVGENSGDLYDTAQVGFSYGAHPAYQYRQMELEIETWGITPELTIDLANSWQLRSTFHYGHSDNTVYQPLSNREKMLDYVEAGLLDPLNVAAADASVIQDILDWQNADEVEQEMYLVSGIADGEVMALPAGILRAAIGLEYIKDEANKRNGDVTRGNVGSLEQRDADRDVKSAFAELSVPVFDSLDLSLSVRYDDYSDFGDTTNPNYGFDYNPVDWLTIYGKWGKSFNAPTVLDSIGVATGRYEVGAAAIVPDPNGERTNPSRDDVFLLEGAGGVLEPQTADIWGLGFELRPIEGLSMHVYYYDIDFQDLLGAPNPTESSAVLLNPDKFIFEPTQDELDSFVGSVENADQFSSINSENVGIIVDRRVSNTDEAKLEGIDFGIDYGHDTRIGYMTYGVLGNYQTTLDFTQNGTVVDQLNYQPDLLVSANIGWSRDNIRARLTLKYTDKYDADPGTAVNQSSVDEFLVTDLFLGYDFRGGSMITDGLSLRFNVDNLLDEDPPEFKRQQNPNYSGFTLGRVFKFGLTKTF